MADTLNRHNNRLRPHPSARVIARALAAVSCVLVGLFVGEAMQAVFGLWRYTPEVFMVLSVIVTPRIMHRLGYRMPPSEPEKISASENSN